MTKTEFISDVTNWSNHRHLLFPALEATKSTKLPVLELGCGQGSTPYLREYCKDEGLELFSYDYDKEWAEKFGAIHVDNWDTQGLWSKEYSVCLIDLSPGEYRRIALMKIKARIIVLHDSEPVGHNSSDYKVRPLFKKFRFLKDYKSDGAWASALSNYINVSKWDV